MTTPEKPIKNSDDSKAQLPTAATRPIHLQSENSQKFSAHSPADTTPALLSPQQILSNRYQILEKIGGGGMGQVYRALDQELDEEVAIKCLQTVQDLNDRKRFEREIRALQKLEHSHIVPFRDFGWEGEQLFFTMDYHPGITLEDVLAARGAVSETSELDWYLSIFTQIAGAMEYLHQRHMVHRDIKPANILLRIPGLTENLPPASEWPSFGNVIASLADFGLVKTRDGDGSLTHTALGTPQYMSPEQIEASPAVDERTDLYAVGVAIYRMATGRLPFNKLSDVLSRQPAPPIRDYNEELPELLEGTLRRLLEFEAYKRPTSASELSQLLHSVLMRKAHQAVGDQITTKMSQPSFCGRSAEVHRLKEAASRVARGAGLWISITGERGSGKSWLVHRSDLKGHALVSDRLTFHPGRFTEQRVHRAFHELLENILRHLERHQGIQAAAAALGPWGRYLPTLIPQLSIDDILEYCPELEESPGDFQKERIIATVVSALTAGAELDPRILVLEDLHYITDFDLEILRRLITTAIELPLLIITTHRPDCEARIPQLEQLLNLVRAEDRLLEIEMQPFTEVESRQMLESMLVPQRSAEDQLIEVLQERTDGIPLYLLHLINSLWKIGTIQVFDNRWHVDPDEVRALPIPETTRSHFLLILDEIPALELKVLNLAAVIGQQFSFDVLLEVVGMDEFELDGLCRNLIHSGLFEEYGNGFRFVHSFEQEILLTRLSQAMRRRLHSRVGKILESQYSQQIDNHLGEIAEHLYLGGEQKRGLDYLYRAAHHAQKNYDPRKALDFYTKALEFCQKQLKRRQLLVTIGELQQQLGEPEAAYRNFSEARQYFTTVDQLLMSDEKLSPGQSNELQEYAALLMLFGDFHGKGGDVSPAMENYEKAGLISRRLQDNSGIAHALIRCGAMHLMSDEFEQAAEHYEKAVRLYKKLPASAGLVGALAGLSRVATFRGNTDEAYSYIKQALRFSEQVGDQARSAGLLSTLGTIERRRGNYEQAARSLEQSIEILEKIGDRRGLAMSLGNLGLLYLSQGDLRKSQESFERAREMFQIAGDKMGALQTIGNIGLLQFYQGQFDSARQWQQEYLDEARARKLKRFEADALIASGLIELECGKFDDAADLFKQGMAIMEETGDHSEATMPLVYLARVYGRLDRYDEASEICERVIEELDGTPREPLGEAQRVLAETLLSRERTEEAEKPALAALKTFEALAQPYHEGICCRTLGKIYRELGYYWADQTGKFFERALRKFEMLGARHALALTQLEYGIFLSMMEDLDRAREYFQSAEQIFTDLAMNPELTRVQQELEDLPQ